MKSIEKLINWKIGFKIWKKNFIIHKEEEIEDKKIYNSSSNIINTDINNDASIINLKKISNSQNIKSSNKNKKKNVGIIKKWHDL